MVLCHQENPGLLMWVHDKVIGVLPDWDILDFTPILDTHRFLFIVRNIECVMAEVPAHRAIPSQVQGDAGITIWSGDDKIGRGGGVIGRPRTTIVFADV